LRREPRSGSRPLSTLLVTYFICAPTRCAGIAFLAPEFGDVRRVVAEVARLISAGGGVPRAPRGPAVPRATPGRPACVRGRWGSGRSSIAWASHGMTTWVIAGGMGRQSGSFWSVLSRSFGRSFGVDSRISAKGSDGYAMNEKVRQPGGRHPHSDLSRGGAEQRS